MEKKLLVLGGTSASLDIVKIAKGMEIYTIVTDDKPDGVAKRIADESLMISTTDLETLCKVVKERKIDGAFCGPSEFNLRNLIRLCEMTGLPCYTTMEQWDRCANKDVFKQYCRDYDVDCTPEYEITAQTSDEELQKIDYPIILKPVDGCSSAGISVCNVWSEVRTAYQKAMDASKCKRIIAEKYIENHGEIFCARYVLRDGIAYPYLLNDTYIVDPVNRKTLISGFTRMPSIRSTYYLEKMDKNVRRMIAGMGLKNGIVFFQALPLGDKIYFHEMGYRLSGGMIFKLAEPLTNVNDMKMMIRYAIGEPMCSEEKLARIDVTCGNKIGIKLMVPLEPGTIGSITGLEEAKKLAPVKDFIQYYYEGETVDPKVVGTLSQHFGRFSIIAESDEEAFDTVETIQRILKVTNTDGQLMNTMPFDTARVRLS